MNKAQRTKLQAAADECKGLLDLDECKALGADAAKVLIEKFESVVTEVAEEEREKFDNMPEGLQASPTGEKLEENADTLENISFPDAEQVDWSNDESIESFIDEVNTAIDEVEAIL